MALPGIIIHFFVGLISFGSHTEVGFGSSLVGLMMLAGAPMNRLETIF